MTTLQIGRVAASLALVLLSGVAHADVVSNVPASGKAALPAAKPVVKLGEAMVQERKTLPDGTVHTQTWLLPEKPQAVKTKADGKKK